MKYEVTHVTKYSYSDAVPVCHNIVHLEPRVLPNQARKGFRMIVHPEPFDMRRGIDSFGNHETYFSVEQAHLGLSITAVSDIHVAPVSVSDRQPTWNEIKALLRDSTNDAIHDALPFAYPTKRTNVFPELREYAAKSFPDERSILDASMELTTRIYTDFKYDPRATNVSTPISEVFRNRSGVCQDFAHFQLACFRAMGLAARYVSGYLRTYPPPGKPRLQGADASHAWVSVYCGDSTWIDFDPTNNMIPETDHITIAWGRDYNDVCPIRGVILGGGTHHMSVSVDVAAK